MDINMEYHGGSMRRLLSHSLSTMNCTPSAVNQFPSGLFSKELRQHGVIVLHFVISFYMFSALSIICHDYFVPAMERIAKVCGIEKNVVGASLMPAIASTPQLAVTVIGVFFVKDDIGLGSVVGSTFFNVLLVPGVFALIVNEVIRLHWWPVFRDCFVYLISVIALTFALADAKISLLDSILMAVIYLVYLVILIFNKRMESLATAVVHFFESQCCPGSTCLVTGGDDSLPPDSEKRNLVNQMALGSSYTNSKNDDKTKDKSFMTPQYTPIEGAIKEEIPMESPASQSKTDSQSQDGDKDDKESSTVEDKSTKESEKESEYKSIMTLPDHKGKLVLWILLLPVSIPIYVFIPDCKRPGCWQNLYILTILSSVICIGVTSYVLVWMMAIVGDTFDINDIIIGMTVLAIGGSLPDMLNSIFVARDGYGDMALANSIGSNIFEVLFCLGIPWMVETASSGKSLDVMGGMMFVSICLIISSLIPLVLISLNSWIIDRKLGGIMILMYILFIVLDTYYELETSPPPCT